MNDMLLEKIDLIRERMNVSYKEARLALEQAEGSVVEALVLLEGKVSDAQAFKQARQEQRRTEFAVKSSELVEQVKELVRQGNISKIRVLHKNEVLFELPLTAGAATILLIPQLALLAGIAVLFAQVTIQIEQPGDTSESFSVSPCNCGSEDHSGCGCGAAVEPEQEPATEELESFSWTAPDAAPDTEPDEPENP